MLTLTRNGMRCVETGVCQVSVRKRFGSWETGRPISGTLYRMAIPSSPVVSRAPSNLRLMKGVHRLNSAIPTLENTSVSIANFVYKNSPIIHYATLRKNFFWFVVSVSLSSDVWIDTGVLADFGHCCQRVFNEIIYQAKTVKTNRR